MKKFYEQPELEVLNFDVEDVITNASFGDILDEDETPVIPNP